MADYVKLPEVARRLDVSEKTARRMVKAGKLPAVFIGGAYRVTDEDLAEYLENARVDPGKAQASSQPDFNGLLEEERRAAQEVAGEKARLLRERGSARMEELLAALRASMEHREVDAARQGYVAAIDKLLKEAYEARAALLRNFLQGMSPQARRAVEEAEGWVPDSDWEQVREADRFCVELVDQIRDAGFPVNESASSPPRIEDAA